MDNIKIWWENLSARERWIVAGGGGLLMLVLLYLYAWQPFTDAVDNVRNQVKTDQALSQWLTPAVKKIQNLKSQGAPAQRQKSQSLLVTVNQTTTKAEISSFVTNIQQVNGNQVSVSFNEVPFDYLIKWLDLLWKQYGIKLAQLTLTPVSDKGLVKVSLSITN